MNNKISHIIKKFFSEGHQRTIKAKKNIISSVGVKSISVLVNLMLIPLTINYVNPTQYGIWLTLSSVVAWFSFFDIGFGHGLRNRFAEANAIGNVTKARIYLSTTYAVLIIIFLSIWVLFLVINFFLDWSTLLNTSKGSSQELSKLAMIVFSFFCLQMVLKTINTVLIADQKPARASFFDMLAQVITLIIIYVLTITTKGSLINLGLALGSVPVLIFLISSLWFFNGKYRSVAPSLKLIDFSYAKDIIKLGSKFFIIQIAVIVIYQTNNIIITQIGTPMDVTIFNIAYKYLGIALMGFTIVISPYWSAFTEAYVQKDFGWMNSTVKSLRKILYLFFIVLILLVLFSQKMYNMWIGDKVYISYEITISVGVYVLMLIIISLNTQILNGIGKIKIQLLTYSLATIGHIPLALFLGKKLGIIGVIASGSFFYIIISFFAIRQVNLLITDKARGIWNQ
jgi:O-antigen/teichoic acid export membrane protein